MKKQDVVFLSASRENEKEIKSGYKFPGWIKAVAEWRGKK